MEVQDASLLGDCTIAVEREIKPSEAVETKVESSELVDKPQDFAEDENSTIDPTADSKEEGNSTEVNKETSDTDLAHTETENKNTTDTAISSSKEEESTSLLSDKTDNGISSTVESGDNISGNPSTTVKLDMCNEENGSVSTKKSENLRQDDDLIQELAEIEGTKKLEVIASDENKITDVTDELQKTSDLLKDLEDDVSVNLTDGQQNEIDDAVKSIVTETDELASEVTSPEIFKKSNILENKNNENDVEMEENEIEPKIIEKDEHDNVQVDSTSEYSLKRKHSEDDLSINVKKQNISKDDDMPDTQKENRNNDEVADNTEIEQPTTSESEVDKKVVTENDELSNDIVSSMDVDSPSNDLLPAKDIEVNDDEVSFDKLSPVEKKSTEIDTVISSTSNESETETKIESDTEEDTFVGETEINEEMVKDDTETNKFVEPLTKTDEEEFEIDVSENDIKDSDVTNITTLTTESDNGTETLPIEDTVTSTNDDKKVSTPETETTKIESLKTQKSLQNIDTSSSETVQFNVTEADSSEEKPTMANTVDSASLSLKADTKITKSKDDSKMLSDSTISLDSTCDVIMDVDTSSNNANENTDNSRTTEKNLNIENKSITTKMKNGSSTPNSPNPSAAVTDNVFNSTPIQKQFETSSENVSKLSETGESGYIKKTMHEKDTDVCSNVNIETKTTDLGSVTGSSTETQSLDNLTRHTNVLKKFNGLTDEVNDEDSTDKMDEGPSHQTHDESNLVSITNGTNLDTSIEYSHKDKLYEISIWCDENELKFLTVEKIDKKKPARSVFSTDVTEVSEKGSSNGSVESVGSYSLASTLVMGAVSNSSASTSGSQKGFDGKFAIPALPQQRTKHTVKGFLSMCNFMIDHFRKLKQSNTMNDSFDIDDDSSSEATTPVTAKGKSSLKKNVAKSNTSSPDATETAVTPKSGKRGSSIKRILEKSTSDVEDEPKAKQVKSQKKSSKSEQTPTKTQTDLPTPDESDSDKQKCEYSVLARWVDKIYYPGRVIEAKTGNKYVVLFADGALKTLPQEYIVFGQDDILPLMNHSIHALVEHKDQTYEPGQVTAVKKEGNVVYYTVVAESKTVNVTAKEIYLEDDQAKIIQNANKATTNDLLKTPETPTSKRAGRPSAKLEESQSTSSSRSARAKKSTQAVTPEPGFSGNVSGKKGRRTKRPEPPTRFSESSDISDTLESDSAPNSPDSALEAVGGVQPELQRTPKESENNKNCLIAEYLGNDRSKTIEDILGTIPGNKALFRSKHFILTCTIPVRTKDTSAKTNGIDIFNQNFKFSHFPFVKDHLKTQIEAGGGTVYNHFEDIPKNRYKHCKLIAPHPCATAKYVQCLAAGIAAFSHEWIITCCQMKSIVDGNKFALPSGWSIIDEGYKSWTIGRGVNQRHNSTPLTNTTVLITSQQKEFTEFWSRVCKLAGAMIGLLKSKNDITATTKGYILMDDEEFPEDIKSKAEHFQIPVVSTVWVIQTLIHGKICCPNSNEKLKQMYLDDDY